MSVISDIQDKGDPRVNLTKSELLRSGDDLLLWVSCPTPDEVYINGVRYVPRVADMQYGGCEWCGEEENHKNHWTGECTRYHKENI